MKKLFFYFVILLSTTTTKSMYQFTLSHEHIQNKLAEYNADLDKVGLWEAKDSSDKLNKEIEDLAIKTKIHVGLEFMKKSSNLSIQDLERINETYKKLQYCINHGSLESMKSKTKKTKKKTKKRNSSKKKKRYSLIFK